MRLHGSARTAPARRAELERVLSGAELPSCLLPAGAVLCVRRLKDPLPGALLKERRALRPPAQWQAALAQQMHELVLQAVRPAVATSAHDAPAVLFASEAELLACLAVSSVEGRLRTEWWWSGLLGSEVEQPWQRWWQQSPECLPLAMAHLAGLGQLPHVVTHLSASEADGLALEVATSFALGELVRRWPFYEDLNAQPKLASAAGHKASHAEARLALTAERSPSDATPRFATLSAQSDVVPGPQREMELSAKGDPNLPANSSQDDFDIAALVPEILSLPNAPEIRAFIALTLGLHRRPHVVSTPGFTDAFVRWQRQVRWVNSASTAARLQSLEQSSSPPVKQTPHEEACSSLNNSPPSHSGALGATGVGHLAVAEAEPQPVSITPLNAQIDSVPAGLERASVGPREVSEPVLASAEAPSELPVSWRLATQEFATDFGGLFYLINVALALELYGDFTQPLRAGIGLSPWDLLALVGRKLLGDPFAQDPLWPTLAELAGRSADEPPGHDVPVPPARLEPDALSKGPAPLADLTGELCLVFEGRLRQALATVQAESRLEWLCRQPARVGIAPTQVHVFYELARHPIEIRFAGLDRDPGWVPAAGRSLYFHYD